MGKYAWELEELDPANGGKVIPYVVKRLREDDDGDLVFKKIYSPNWKEALGIIRASLDLLEKTLQSQDDFDARQAAKPPQP